MSDFDISTLWTHPLFAVLSPAQRQWLTERLVFEKIPARTVIYHSAEKSKVLYFILNGKVIVEASSASGDSLIKGICYERDFFGLKGLFGEATFREHARTLRTTTVLVKFNIQDLLRLAEVNFEFTQKIMDMVWQELLFLEKRTSTFTELSARDRFKKFLKEMTKREGQYDGKEWFFNSQLTQAEIGSYIGTGRQTVTEILNEFRQKGILRYEWGRFFVQDLEAL